MVLHLMHVQYRDIFSVDETTENGRGAFLDENAVFKFISVDVALLTSLLLQRGCEIHEGL